MNRLIQALLLTLSLAMGASSAMAAKDDAKPAGADKAAASAASGEKATKKSDSASADKGKAGAQLDINSASEDDLKALPQIGDARASAIVKGRPYARKDELVSKKVLTQKQYDGIKDKIIAKQGAGGADKASAGASSSAASKSSAAGATGDKATKKTEGAK